MDSTTGSTLLARRGRDKRYRAQEDARLEDLKVATTVIGDTAAARLAWVVAFAQENPLKWHSATRAAHGDNLLALAHHGYPASLAGGVALPPPLPAPAVDALHDELRKPCAPSSVALPVGAWRSRLRGSRRPSCASRTPGRSRRGSSRGTGSTSSTHALPSFRRCSGSCSRSDAPARVSRLRNRIRGRSTTAVLQGRVRAAQAQRSQGGGEEGEEGSGRPNRKTCPERAREHLTGHHFGPTPAKEKKKTPR